MGNRCRRSNFHYIAIYHKVVTTKNHLLSRWPFSPIFLGQELEPCASHRWIDLARQISIFSGICADLQQIPCLQRLHLDKSVKGLYPYNWSYLFSLPSRSSNWTTDFQLYSIILSGLSDLTLCLPHLMFYQFRIWNHDFCFSQKLGKCHSCFKICCLFDKRYYLHAL